VLYHTIEHAARCILQQRRVRAGRPGTSRVRAGRDARCDSLGQSRALCTAVRFLRMGNPPKCAWSRQAHPRSQLELKPVIVMRRISHVKAEPRMWVRVHLTVCCAIGVARFQKLLCVCVGAVCGQKVFPVAIGEFGSRFTEVRQHRPATWDDHMEVLHSAPQVLCTHAGAAGQ